MSYGRRSKKKERKCFTSNFVLDELATLLFRRTGAGFAETRLLNIYASSRIQILRPTKDDEITAITFMKKYSDQEISYTDCISFCLMEKIDWILLLHSIGIFRMQGLLFSNKSIKK